jgi:hypothetical protein
MNRKIRLLPIILTILICLGYSSLNAQGRIYGSKPVSATGSFKLNVIEDEHHHHWCHSIDWFIEWFRDEFHGHCGNYKPPFNNDKDADCALEYIGFSKDKIKWIKQQNEYCQQEFLIREVICNPRYSKNSKPFFPSWNGFTGIGYGGFIINSYQGKPIVINLSGF